MIKGVGCASIITPKPVQSIDYGKRFLEIPTNYADIIIADANEYIKNKEIPLLIDHVPSLRVGKVVRMYRDKIKDNNTYKDCVKVDFEINNPHFIRAIQNATRSRFTNIVTTNIKSSDQFIADASNLPCRDETDKSVLDLTVKFALTQKLPEISLSHNRKDETKWRKISEVSLSMAGARPLTVVENATFTPFENTTPDTDLTSEHAFMTHLAATASVSSAFQSKKVLEDYHSTDMETTIFDYRLDAPETNKSTTTMSSSDSQSRLIDALQNASSIEKGEIARWLGDQHRKRQRSVDDIRVIDETIDKKRRLDDVTYNQKEIINQLKNMQDFIKYSTGNRHHQDRIPYQENQQQHYYQNQVTPPQQQQQQQQQRCYQQSYHSQPPLQLSPNQQVNHDFQSPQPGQQVPIYQWSHQPYPSQQQVVESSQPTNQPAQQHPNTTPDPTKQSQIQFGQNLEKMMSTLIEHTKSSTDKMDDFMKRVYNNQSARPNQVCQIKAPTTDTVVTTPPVAKSATAQVSDVAVHGVINQPSKEQSVNTAMVNSQENHKYALLREVENKTVDGMINGVMNEVLGPTI